MYKCAVDKNEEADVDGYKKVIAISPSQGQVGDYSDGYGAYHYTYFDFEFEAIPVIPQDVKDYMMTFDQPVNKLLFKAKEDEITTRTVEELQAE